MKIEFSRQIFEKYSQNFMKIRPEIRVSPFGRTDRHTEGNSRFSKFCDPV